MSDVNHDAIIEAAKQNADKWVKAFVTNGDPNVEKIQEILNKRTFNGEPVLALVVRSPNEVLDALISGVIMIDTGKRTKEELESIPKNEYNKLVKKVKESLKDQFQVHNIHRFIWDYYYMAFYESIALQLPDRDFEGAEFIYQSLFPAFEQGLGYVINYGSLLIGVCLPEAYKDDAMRIHKEDGPAIVWGNDKQYWWHGVSVPEEWIMDKNNVDPQLCLTHENIEQRRALCEILGWDKVIDLLDAKEIQRDEFGVLLEVDLPDSPKTRFVRVYCPTGRYFCIPVPSEVTTAHEAVAQTYGVNITDYNPEVRT